MGCFIICETINATVQLQETDIGSNAFQLLVTYSGSGVVSTSGSQTVAVSGNLDGSFDVSGGSVSYSIQNWNLTPTSLHLTITASISGQGMGPDYIFSNAPVGGDLPAVIHANNLIRLKRAQILDSALHGALPVECNLSNPYSE
jgi:hypothetical protein